MLTPAFEVDQDDTYVYLKIKAPYIKASEGEFYINENEFKFYVKPYFLRLTFPGCITENGQESALYNVDTGIYSVKLPKSSPGENFPDLDLLTLLLTKRKTQIKHPLIELIETTKEGELDEGEEQDGDVGDTDEDGSYWEVEQSLADFEELEKLSISGHKYGFATRVTGVFARLGDEMSDIIDVENPEELSFTERRDQRIAAERLKFDGEHYLADFFETDQIDDFMQFEAHWDKQYQETILQHKKCSYPETSGHLNESSEMHLLTHPADGQKISYTEEEKEQLRQLPNKDYILNKHERNLALLGLVDIVYAYAYNHRTTEGENTTESAWTVCKLSTTLSWLQTSPSLREAVTSSVRRALCYPLYRNWKLAIKVLEDTKRIFLLGRRCILKCLLDVHRLLGHDERVYLLNELYITDYCVWAQKTNKKWFKSIVFGLQNIELSKQDCDLGLDTLEMAGISVQQSTKEDKDLDPNASSENESEISYDSDDISESEEVNEQISAPNNERNKAV